MQNKLHINALLKLSYKNQNICSVLEKSPQQKSNTYADGLEITLLILKKCHDFGQNIKVSWESPTLGIFSSSDFLTELQHPDKLWPGPNVISVCSKDLYQV